MRSHIIKISGSKICKSASVYIYIYMYEKEDLHLFPEKYSGLYLFKSSLFYLLNNQLFMKTIQLS